MRQMTRRGFGRAAGFSLAGAGLALAQRRKPGLAVQVYSVRKVAAEDFAGTLAGLGKMGYEAVEFAGFYGKSAPEVKKYLADAGLKVAGAHVGIDLLMSDKLQETVDFHKEIGNRNLVVPGLPAKMRASKEAWRETAKIFTDLVPKLGSMGMRTGYHNHTVEFELMDGEKPWDILFQNTPKSMIMQLDIGHCLRAGTNPVEVLKKYPGQALSVHVKEYHPTNKAALIGDGEMPWKEVLAACETVAGTEWYIIEEESNAYPGLTGVEQCLQRLKKML